MNFGAVFVIGIVVFLISLALTSRMGKSLFTASAATVAVILFSGALFSLPWPKSDVESWGLGLILAAGTFWFWVFAVAMAVMLISFVEYEKNTWATLSVISAFVLFQFLGDVKIFSFLFAHTWWFLIYLVGYVAGGIIWSLVKWYCYVHEELRSYYEKQRDFLRAKGVQGDDIPDRFKVEWYYSLLHDSFSAAYRNHVESFLQQRLRVETGTREIPEALLPEWKEYVRTNLEAFERFDPTPQAWEHKDRLLLWLMHWPWSLVWTVIDDPLKRLFTFIFRKLQATYQKIADHAFRNVRKDFRF